MESAADLAKHLKERKENKVLSFKEIVQFLNSYDEGEVNKGLSQLKKTIDKAHRKDKSSNLPDDKSDVLFQYLSSSPECSEIFSIWDFAEKNQLPNTAVQCIDALASLLHCNNFSSLRHLNRNISRKLIKGKVKNIYTYLNLENPRSVKASLRLMTEIIISSVNIAKDFFRTFNWAWKPLHLLVDKRAKAKQDRDYDFNENVRTQYLRFALAFLKVGDSVLLQEVLSIQGFVSSFVKTIEQDPFEIIEEFLNTLREKVAVNKHLSRKTKASFFNGYFLEQVAKLYESSNERIKKCAHNFLTILCCSEDGLCSIKHSSKQKMSSETPAKVKFRNKTILRLLSCLKPSSDLLQQSLALGILSLCPELIPTYLKDASLSFEPRFSMKWLENMSFLTKLWVLPVPNMNSIYLPGDTAVIIGGVFPPNVPRGYCSRESKMTRILLNIPS